MSPFDGSAIYSSNAGVFSSLWRGLSWRHSRHPGQRSLPCKAVASPTLLSTIDSSEVCLVPLTSAYALDGYFTGIKSKVVVPQSTVVVYESLAKNLHHIFQTIEECKDTIKEEDGSGRQLLHRYVRIPFTLSYFSGNIKMTMEVENNKPKNEILFSSINQGRFLAKFLASFVITPLIGADGHEHTCVELDSRLVVKKLPPPPLKGLVKGIVVKKMHRCMAELAEFHSGGMSQKPLPRSAKMPGEYLQCSDIVTSSGTYALRREMNTAQREERPSLL